MLFVNYSEKLKDAFFDFLRENLKNQNFSFFEFLPCIEEQRRKTGADFYELPGRLTKSGNPETFYYKTKTVFFDENDNETDPGENDFAYCETRFYL